MAFSEGVKQEVKRRAFFSCCICNSIGVEVHHIVPQAEGGPDTSDNAAPLCPNCHDVYGNNPGKRKFIRETRDHWYELCETRRLGDSAVVNALIHQLEALPTRADLEQMKDSIVEAMRLRQTTDSPPRNKALSLGEIIGWIYTFTPDALKINGNVVELVFRVVYAINKEISEESEENIREFTRMFGQETVRRLCCYTLAMELPHRLNDRGLTEVEIQRIIDSVLITMIFVRLHRECANDAGTVDILVAPTGQILAQAATDGALLTPSDQSQRA